MDYRTFQAHPDLASLVKCYWTLEVPARAEAGKQRIVPDGCLEMAFILGDDIKRYTSESGFILQVRAMVLGQITEPFFIEPLGAVKTFAIRFCPFGFSNFVDTPLNLLANKETPLGLLFGEGPARALEQKVSQASSTEERISAVEEFLFDRLQAAASMDKIVKTTIDALLATNGSASIRTILKNEPSKRRQLERKFIKQIGVSPKQMGKVIRLQTALNILLNEPSGSLTRIAYESDYFDQAHFAKDFKEFTGISPKEFLGDDSMALSALFYK